MLGKAKGFMVGQEVAAAALRTSDRERNNKQSWSYDLARVMINLCFYIKNYNQPWINIGRKVWVVYHSN